MHQLVKLTGAIWLLQLAISSPVIHALVWPESSYHQDLKAGSPAWEVNNLPTELSLPPFGFYGGTEISIYLVSEQGFKPFYFMRKNDKGLRDNEHWDLRYKGGNINLLHIHLLPKLTLKAKTTS